MAASAIEIEDFLTGPLVTWLSTCLPETSKLISDYSSLWDGSLLYSVLLQIDPEPCHSISKLTGLDTGQALVTVRIRNFDYIVKNLRTLYEEEFGQKLLVIPDCVDLGKSPESKCGLDNMKSLILLLLGAAVQCPNKELFIRRIEQLDLSIQHQIMLCIRQVTDEQAFVLTSPIDRIDPSLVYDHMMRLSKDRDKYMDSYMGMILSESLTSIDSTTCVAQSPGTSRRRSITMSSSSGLDSNHLAVELADWKARMRKQRQELEDKSEAFIACKEELEHVQVQFAKLKTESQEWLMESRRAAAYRDEIDVLRERSERADRLEIEVQRLRDKLCDAEFYKTRVDELREDNKVLLDTREMLEEQLSQARKRSDHAMALETEIIKYKQRINELALEHDLSQSKLQELIDENTQLHLLTDTRIGDKTAVVKTEIDTDSDGDDCVSGENSLSEQLTNNAQTRALKLDLENRRLQAAIDLKESSFSENCNTIYELEKENKKLTLKCEQLQSNCNRLTQHSSELEVGFNNALEENKKLFNSLDVRKATSDRLSQERELDKIKLSELEKLCETVVVEKQQVQNLSDSIKRRADDLERTLNAKLQEIQRLNEKIVDVNSLKKNITELSSALIVCEKENCGLSKDVARLRETVEEKDVTLDKYTNEFNKLNKEFEQSTKELDDAILLLSKLQSVEKESHELKSQSQIDAETIVSLQKDLVSQTLNTEKLKIAFDKLGLNFVEILDCDSVEVNLEKIIVHPENQTVLKEIINKLHKDNAFGLCSNCKGDDKSLQCESNNQVSAANDLLAQTEQVVSTVSKQWKLQCDQLCNELSAVQIVHDNVQAENAKLKVDISTLSSQINSLTTQHVALQLANSQLVAEKEELIKKHEQETIKHETVRSDQVTLQCLHEQLSTEYEVMLNDQEVLKAMLRDLRTENRALKERTVLLQTGLESAESDKQTLKVESQNLVNLRAEHSKLKDDFRNLFTASDRLKAEYRSIQEQYRTVRSENSRLKLQHTELTGEINNKSDQLTELQLEVSKANQRCELLIQMNNTLDSDRRSLMDHVSQLLTQYHELLAHSLEDKQHYHDEEKVFTDKVNNLRRQKEKLEEKIMEHYRKLDSCSPKKKSFGSSFVKKVRKAGSDLISKVPSRNRQTWIDDSRQLQYIAGESAGNESDNSTEDKSAESIRTEKCFDGVSDVITRGGIRGSLQAIHGDDMMTTSQRETLQANRKSFQGFENDATLPAVASSTLDLGTAGTRRTVYIAPEDNPNQVDSKNTAPVSVEPEQPSTFLMYNRINTVLSTDQSGRLSPGSSDKSNKDKPDNAQNKSKESAIWYEYGCV